MMRAILFIVMLWATGARADGPSVEYTVTLRDPQTQYVEMSMTLRGVQGPTVDFCLPVWRPGRYVVLDPVTTVSGVRARSGRGKDLVCEKIEKSCWIVQTDAAAGDDQVVIDYRVYCNSLGDRTRHVDDTHAFLSPSSVFIYAPEFRAKPIRVRVTAPEGWKIATGLSTDPKDRTVLVAPDYDVLADSPLEIGFHDTISFVVDGIPHELDVWNGRKDAGAGLGPSYDKAKIVDQLTRLIRVQRDIFGDLPYSRYVFLLHCVPGAGGGTEHLNSTIMQTGPAAFADAAGLKRFMSLASHEFFHTWNVKQLRPAGLKPMEGRYDYQRENYTDLLWVSEGTTDYFQVVTLVRAAINKPDDLFKTLGGWVDSARTIPGAAVQSAAESSFDAWIKFNRSWADSGNTTVSFYDKGAWISLVLDMEIRKRSQNKASLDTVMRDLYRAFPLTGPGFTQQDLERAAERLTGSSFREFFADFVTGTRALDFEGALAVAGLEVTHDLPKKTDKDEPSDEEPTAGPKQMAYIGLRLSTQDGLASVSSVQADGPAYKAGVIAGDLILSINGRRLKSSADLDAQLKLIKPGDTVRLAYFRYDHLQELEFKADGRLEGKWTVRRVKSPTDAQKAAYESWLGQQWPAPKDKPAETQGAQP